jgi:hypothetical protein
MSSLHKFNYIGTLILIQGINISVESFASEEEQTYTIGKILVFSLV